MNADHVGDLSAPVLAGGAGAAPAAALAQQGEQLLLQLPAGIGVDGVVDRFVGHALAWVIGMHALQCAGDLLGRPAPEQKIADRAPEAAVRMHLGGRTHCVAAGLAGCLGGPQGIAIARGAVAFQVPAHGAGAAPEQTSDGSPAPSLLDQRGQCEAFFGLQVRVSRSHLCKFPEVRMLHFRFETASPRHAHYGPNYPLQPEFDRRKDSYASLHK
ncbi:hypothetical protein SAMN04489708_103207 [Paracidovorax cattleyae]|uniref:Uncharacterized protein n=1 Tax=Paracidovorax cattleyae TaxID=80868 RepID=A0A1H0MCH0_9BURK|nr:hypothetical protein SAMN04489708_103207 [Paracidovorax cattleyae]